MGLRHHMASVCIVLSLALMSPRASAQTSERPWSIGLVGTVSAARLSFPESDHWRAAFSFQTRVRFHTRFHAQAGCTIVQPDSDGHNPIILDSESREGATLELPEIPSSDIGYCAGGIGLQRSFLGTEPYLGVGLGRFFYGDWGHLTWLMYAGASLRLTKSLSAILELRESHVPWPGQSDPWNHELAVGITWTPGGGGGGVSAVHPAGKLNTLPGKSERKSIAQPLASTFSFSEAPPEVAGLGLAGGCLLTSPVGGTFHILDANLTRLAF